MSEAHIFCLRSKFLSYLLSLVCCTLMLSSATAFITNVSIIILKTNLFNFIAVGGNSHDTVIAVLGTVDAIEHQTVAIDI